MSDSSMNDSRQARQPLVSVVMNCHNSARYLREAIESVLAQTYRNWEIIFWDNQSTDDSARIFRSYSDDRLHYFYAPEFMKLGEARNLAVARAKGEWLGFLDCDDLWLPDKLSSQVDIILNETPELGIVYGQCLVIRSGIDAKTQWAEKQNNYTHKTVLKRLPEGRVFEKLLKFNFIPLLTAIVSKEAYDDVGGLSAHYEQAEDYELFVNIAARRSVRAVQDVVALYRVHDSNRSIGASEISHREVLEIVGRHLPSAPAKRGLRYHHTVYAINLLKERNFAGGIAYLMSHGDYISLFAILIRKISRKL